MNTNQQIIADLGKGLVLRRSTPEDTESLAEFNGKIHAFLVEDSDQVVAQWTRDLMTKPHPTFHPDDFTLVEKTDTGEIVSCMCLIDQTWAYEGIEFGVGRPEIVGTRKDYRKGGLVRKQFEVIHQWSQQRGQQMQAITGIPYYYRQYGYEMALDLDFGRKGYPAHIPQLNKDEKEKFNFRPATYDDLAYITELHMHNYQRYPVVCKFEPEIWRYMMDIESPHNPVHCIIQVIEDLSGKRVGFLVHRGELIGSMVKVNMFELEAGVSWLEVTPAVLRYLQRTGETYAVKATEESKDKKTKHFGGYYFTFGSNHPVYDATPEYLPEITDKYAWYVRVPDLIGFMQHIAPALEDRLARSLAANHSGDLWLNMFTSGIHMAFENGKLKVIEPWDQPEYGKSSAYISRLAFLQVLFGHRDIDEMHHIHADAYANPSRPMEAQLFRLLFPKKPSNIWAVE